MDKAWVGVDVGKEFHWAYVLDASGKELLSRRVENDEAELLKLIDEALALADSLRKVSSGESAEGAGHVRFFGGILVAT